MARHSQRPGKEQWQQLEHCRSLEAFLQMARQSSLGGWVRHFEAGDDSGTWERSLRRDWQAYLAQLVSWTPARWQPALAWTAVLPSLPGIARVLSGKPPAAWMDADDFFRGMNLHDSPAFREELGSGPWGALLEAWEDNSPLGAWRLSWQPLWPRHRQSALPRLDAGWHLLDKPEMAWAEELDAFLVGVMRYQQPTILAATAHLGLLSLDLGRLRGNLLSRQLRAQQARAAA